MSRLSGFDRFRASAAVLLALVAAPLAPAQVLSDNFGSGTLNPATWFQDKTIANLSAVPANGRLEFRATANGSIPGETLNYAATSLEPGIGTVSGSQVSVKMNLTKATPAQSNWDEGLAVLFTDVETEAPSLNELPPSFVFAIGSYKELAAGPQVRYMVLMSIDDAGQETEYWYAEESPSGKFTNALLPDPDVTGSTVTVPSTGAIPVFFSLVKGATSWTLRVGFTSFSNTANSFSVKLSLDDVGDRPYRPSLVGYLNGPINVALTGARSHFDDFVVQQGVLSRRPEGLTASQGTFTTGVKLQWTAPVGAGSGTSYRVYRTSNLATPIGTTTSTSFEDTTALPGVVTQYCIRAFTVAAGESEHSDFVTGRRGFPLPTVSAVSPTTGPTTGNTLITVTGTNFVTGATTVTVGGVAATSVSVTSATTLTARTPAGTAGPKTVSVTTAGGTGPKANAFTYVAGMPTPPGGDSGGTVGGSSAASMSAPGSAGTGASTAGSSGDGAYADWAPDTGIPALDGYLVLSSGAGVSWSECGEAPETDLDGNGEADLCQLRRGDLDLDGDVDAADGELLFSLVGRHAHDGIADLDHDGWVTVLDAAICRAVATMSD